LLLFVVVLGLRVSGFKRVVVVVAAMEVVGNDLSAGADDLVLESAPQMAEQVAKEVAAAQESALAEAGDSGVMELEDAGASGGTGTHFWRRHSKCLSFFSFDFVIEEVFNCGLGNISAFPSNLGLSTKFGFVIENHHSRIQFG